MPDCHVPAAYYNDNDLGVCAWLRELIRRGHLPAGDVDERSITDVQPDDLAGYAQCHFFAGIGGWPLALRLAGWPDDRPVWTASLPCQPFSSAGKRLGANDERHLAPAFLELVRTCRPPLLFGEQVASSAVLGRAQPAARHGAPGAPEWAWLDDLFDRLEALGYACGAADIPAAGVGAPHIRQRCWWGAVRLADRIRPRLEGQSWNGDRGSQPGRFDAKPDGPVAETGDARRMADGTVDRRRKERQVDQGVDAGNSAKGRGAGSEPSRSLDDQRPSPLDGFWRDADWLFCRDGKWRPVEPGTFPLADGIPGRVGLLRGYGNAIVPQVAAEFVTAFMAAADA